LCLDKVGGIGHDAPVAGTYLHPEGIASDQQTELTTTAGTYQHVRGWWGYRVHGTGGGGNNRSDGAAWGGLLAGDTNPQTDTVASEDIGDHTFPSIPLETSREGPGEIPDMGTVDVNSYRGGVMRVLWLTS
jgi:hypothetical protein